MEPLDPIESCPYNIMHRIRRSRMQFHVTTCAQNNRHKGMLQCPFDARHVIKRVEFEHHKNTCPGRESVLNYAIHDAKSQAKLKILPIDVNPVGKWKEKWDKDPDVRTYNPIKNIKNKPIVYALIGVSKSKRQKHRLAERARYNRVMENQGLSMSQNSSHSQSMDTSSKLSCLKVVYEIGDSSDEQVHTPLRPPAKFLATNPLERTVDKVTNRTPEVPVYIERSHDPEKSSTASEIDETSNDSSSFVAMSLSNQRNVFSKIQSEDCRIFEELPKAINITAANDRDQDKHSMFDKTSVISNENEYQFFPSQYKDQQKNAIPDLLSIASNRNDYQYEPYQHNNQKKNSIPYAASTVSSMDDYGFEPYRPKDQENCFISDAMSDVSSMNDYGFEPYQPKDQEKCFISDAMSTVSSMDDYGFEPYQPKDQEKCSITDALSNVSNKKEYQFESNEHKNSEKCSIPDLISIVSCEDKYEFVPCQYKEQEKSSIPDTVSVVSSTDEYQFEPYRCKDQERFSNADAVSITFSKDKYQVPVSFSDKVSKKSLSLTTGETLEVTAAFSHEDESAVHVLSKNIEKEAENDEYKSSLPITDIVYDDVFSEDGSIYDMNSEKWGSEKSLSLSTDKILQVDEVFSYIEEDTAVRVLLKDIEKVAENDKHNSSFPVTDVVYDEVFNEDESQYDMASGKWETDVLLSSSEIDESSSESLSYETAQSSHNNSISPTESLENASLVEKLFQTIKGIAINGKSHEGRSESLNHKRDVLNKLQSNEKSEKNSTHVDSNKGKLFRRCAANFLNLKS